MHPTTTAELVKVALQEEQTLQYAQQIAIRASLPFNVPGNIFSHLLALKFQSEERYLSSLQRREVLKNRLESQRLKLKQLNRLYNQLKRK